MRCYRLPGVEVASLSAAVVSGFFRSSNTPSLRTRQPPRDEKDSTSDVSGSAKAPFAPLAKACHDHGGGGGQKARSLVMLWHATGAQRETIPSRLAVHFYALFVLDLVQSILKAFFGRHFRETKPRSHCLAVMAPLLLENFSAYKIPTSFSSADISAHMAVGIMFVKFARIFSSIGFPDLNSRAQSGFKLWLFTPKMVYALAQLLRRRGRTGWNAHRRGNS